MVSLKRRTPLFTFGRDDDDDDEDRDMTATTMLSPRNANTC